MLDRPAVGVAKSLLCGRVKVEDIELAGQVLGQLVNGRLYVSVGHRISLGTAVDTVKRLVAEKSWMPELLRLADEMSKK